MQQFLTVCWGHGLGAWPGDRTVSQAGLPLASWTPLVLVTGRYNFKASTELSQHQLHIPTPVGCQGHPWCLPGLGILYLPLSSTQALHSTPRCRVPKTSFPPGTVSDPKVTSSLEDPRVRWFAPVLQLGTQGSEASGKGRTQI